MGLLRAQVGCRLSRGDSERSESGVGYLRRERAASSAASCSAWLCESCCLYIYTAYVWYTHVSPIILIYYKALDRKILMQSKRKMTSALASFRERERESLFFIASFLRLYKLFIIRMAKVLLSLFGRACAFSSIPIYSHLFVIFVGPERVTACRQLAFLFNLSR